MASKDIAAAGIVQLIGMRLRALYDARLDPETVDQWYAQARDFRELVASYQAWSILPHSVEHYLADADIRIGEEDYRKRQDQLLEPIIVALAHGILPPSDAV